MSEIRILLDESAIGEKTRGTEMIERDGQMFCPKCLERIEPSPGYGLVFGGMGVYWYCETEGCEWFYKVMDAEDDDNRTPPDQQAKE